MTTTLIASAAVMPMLALSMPFAHMQANADIKAGHMNNGHFSAELQLKEKCKDGQKALVAKKNADIKAYKASHEFDSAGDITAYVKWRQQLQVDFVKAKKQLKIDCKKDHSSSSMSSSVQSSVSSSVSSVSSSSTTSSANSTGSSVSSSSPSSVSSHSSLSSTGSGSQAGVHGNAWWKLWLR